MEPRPEQDLVRVDVADPGQDLLVHQGRLDPPRVVRPSRSARSSAEISRASGPCDRANAASAAASSTIPGDLAQPPRVAEPDRLDRALADAKVTRTCSGRVGRDQPKSSRHPRLDDDSPPVPPSSSITTHLPRRPTTRTEAPPTRRSNSSAVLPCSRNGSWTVTDRDDLATDQEPAGGLGPSSQPRASSGIDRSSD